MGGRTSRVLWRFLTVVALGVAWLPFSRGIPAAHAATTHHVAYVTDFGGGMGDANPPNPNPPGSSIFTNALLGGPLANGGTYDGAVFNDLPIASIDANPSTALNGFDTAVLYEVCTIGAHPVAVSAINSFLANGGKVMIFDADGCAIASGARNIIADYSGFLFPFQTNSPGPQGAQNRAYTFKEISSLTNGLPAVGAPIGDDAIGDANVFTSHAGAWCNSLQGQNVNGATNDVEAYARTQAGGLAIYEGEDFWFTDVHSGIIPSGGDPHLINVFNNMLEQAWNPDGLPCSNPVSGIKLDPADATNPVGTPHTDTATVVNSDATPAAGVVVTFNVLSGPDAGLSAVNTTDGSGHATFTFTDTTVPGDDVVQAHFVDGSGTTEFSNKAVKHWIQIHTNLAVNPSSQDFNDLATVSATLTDANNVALSGQTVNFVLNGAETCSGTTDGSGVASCTLTPGEAAGTYTLTATYAGDISHVGSSGSAPFTVTHEETTLTYTGSTTQDFNDQTTLSGNLTEDGVTPIAGRTVSFSFGTQSCSGVTDASGNASCSITPNQAAGSYPLTASFAGDAFYAPSSDTSRTFIVTLEESAVTSTSSLQLFAANGTATLSSVLTDPIDGVAVSGKPVTMTLGSGGSAQSCTATTDGSGTATCAISPVTVPLGPQPVTDNFAGDAFYKPASNLQSALVYANLANGSFVLGDMTAASALATTPAPAVNWWGAQWWKNNQLSGGTAPAAFKGFANTLTPAPAACGGTWTTDPGNSSGPPSSVPSFMSVIVSSKVTQSGSTISGNIPEVVIVKTNPGYAGNPGHAGTGTIVAVLCHS
jgi:Bacterial Ig-like domain (group 3)